MKSSVAIIALALAANVALGQTSGSGSPAPQAQTGAATASTPAQHQPQAKSKEEFEAYNAATSKTDPAQLEVAAAEFVQKFPNSELKELLYVRAMNMYQQQNNSGKVIATGRKAIELNPADPVPLVAVASALVMDTRENDLDRDARYAEAGKDAQSALDNVDTGLQVPPGVPPDRIAAAKANLRSIAYDSLGVIAMNKKDYAAAEQNFQKAADLMKDQPDAVVYLRLSVAQDNQSKYPEALDSANKAVQYAPDGSAEKNLAKQQQARLQKLIAEKAPAATPAAQPH
ncbi:MAG TPA: tetratricopeptide repeat protein [Candidatus Methylomirabilis sp.]|nr:tetratricopeptide repeat protein [Candidatus Methylomirabilis sp.]